MESTPALERLLTDSLLSRNLARFDDGRLEFVRNGNAIELTVEATTYRGHVITMLAGSRKIEFRTQLGGFNSRQQFDGNPVPSLQFNAGASRVLPEPESDGPSGEPWTGTNTLPIELSRVLPIDDPAQTLSTSLFRFASFWSNRPSE